MCESEWLLFKWKWLVFFQEMQTLLRVQWAPGRKGRFRWGTGWYYREVYLRNGQVSVLNNSKPLYNFRLIEFSRIRGFYPFAYFVEFCWNAAIPKRINQTIKQLRIHPETHSTPIHNDKMFICIPFGNIMYA